MRHRGIVLLLWAHAVVIPGFALIRGFSPIHTALETLVLPVTALAANQSTLSRRTRTAISSLGLLTASALLVHLSGGVIEMHFHFFVMVAVVALYQDWVPFLSSIAYVLVQHGVMGVIDPRSVFNHPAALAHPWRWAAIHAFFITGISVACVISWRLSENSLAQERTTAIMLQHSLLPAGMPEVTGAELGRKYAPASSHDLIGGDWYDVLPLPSGLVALTIGDVMGHDLRAAAVMGQVRNMMRIASLESSGPADALDHVDGYMAAVGLTDLATALHVVFDPVDHSVVLASAGHLPPVLIHADGRSELVAVDPLPPLGASLIAEHRCPGADRRLVLDPGDTLVLYTDGLVETTSASLGDGLARLVLAAGMPTTGDADELCDRLIAGMVGDSRQADDVAVLVLRLDPADDRQDDFSASEWRQ